MDDTSLAIVLWGVTAVFLGWTWIPALISGLGGTRYSNGGSEDAEALTPSPSEPDYAFWHAQLIALGYRPLGPAWMRLTLHGPFWRYEMTVRAFHSRAERSFAFIQKQPRPLDVWSLVIFATCWRNGGLLLTNNQSDETPDEGEFVVQGKETNDLAALQVLHRTERDRLIAVGRTPDPDGGIETLLKATRDFASASARQVGLRMGQMYLATHFIIHALISAPIIYLVGFLHWAGPCVNLGLGAMLSFGEYLARRRAGELMRQNATAASKA